MSDKPSLEAKEYNRKYKTLRSMNFNLVYEGQLLLIEALFTARRGQNWPPYKLLELLKAVFFLFSIQVIAAYWRFRVIS